MYNVSPLIKRQWEIIHEANTLITIYEQGIPELKAKVAHDMAAVKQRYERTEEKYAKREREVERWKKQTERISQKGSLNGGTPQKLLLSTHNPLQRIDDSIEMAKEQQNILESSMQAKSRSPLVIVLLLFATTALIVMFINVIILNTLNIFPLPAGVEAADATSTVAHATSTVADATYTSAQATAGRANGIDATDPTAQAANKLAESAFNNATSANAQALQASSVANATTIAADATTWIILSSILSIIFLGSGLAVRRRIRRQMQANWRNHYATILLALEDATTMLQEQHRKAKIDFDSRLNESEQQTKLRREQLQQTLVDGFTRLNSGVRQYVRSAGLPGADWQDTSQQLTIPSSASLNVIRCGKMIISYQQQHTQPFPFFIPFPAGQSVLLQAPRNSYEQATMFLQSLLLRLVTTQLPGMVRFTFFDPLHFGQHVAPFMQLATYNSTLVGERIWTESSHIEQQLATLSEYLARVNQQYLWGAAPTIEEYNQQNPHNSLPYHMLVVLGFPFRFSLSAVQRLFTIARNGPRCGVYAIILCDMEQLSASSFSLKDLTQTALTLRWEGQQVFWDDVQSVLSTHNVT